MNFGFRAYMFLSRCDSFLFLNPVTSPILVSLMLRITPGLHWSQSQLLSTSYSFVTAFSVVLSPCVGSSSAITCARFIHLHLSIWMLVPISSLGFFCNYPQPLFMLIIPLSICFYTRSSSFRCQLSKHAGRFWSSTSAVMSTRNAITNSASS